MRVCFQRKCIDIKPPVKPDHCLNKINNDHYRPIGGERDHCNGDDCLCEGRKLCNKQTNKCIKPEEPSCTKSSGYRPETGEKNPCGMDDCKCNGMR